MMFLYVISLIVFVVLTIGGLLVAYHELTMTKQKRQATELLGLLNGVRYTYWNVRVLVFVVLWVASGVVVFW